jgi:hypothetical protein
MAERNYAEIKLCVKLIFLKFSKYYLVTE